MQIPSKQQINAFQAAVRQYYNEHGRHNLPWRVPEAGGGFDPYKILVSEMMLQQTQVPRVIPKFQDFVRCFPNVQSLASAPLSEVLKLWSGLGYNRRAKFLWQTAQKIVQDFNGIFPHDIKALQSLPGIGSNTAGAVIVYAFNQPAVFIETNIRTVFTYHFLQDQPTVSDKSIAELLEQTLDRQDPRSFFWALMDYGSFLKKSVGNLNHASKSYAKQSPFQGSRRQIRGQVIRALLDHPLGYQQLTASIVDQRLLDVLGELQAEGFIDLKENHYHLLAH